MASCSLDSQCSLALMPVTISVYPLYTYPSLLAKTHEAFYHSAAAASKKKKE